MTGVRFHYSCRDDKMKVKLIKIGRQKVTKVITVSSLSDILFEVKKYLISQDVRIVFNNVTGTGNVYAGIQHVGKVKILSMVQSERSKFDIERDEIRRGIIE